METFTAKEVHADMEPYRQASIRKTRNGRERRTIYGELKDLRKEYRQREARVIGDLLRSSEVVLATLHGSGGYQLKDQHFDVVIVDEASQVSIASRTSRRVGVGSRATTRAEMISQDRSGHTAVVEMG